MVAITQIRNDCVRRNFFLRKQAEGKSPKEALRALKRRISSAIYRQLVVDAGAVRVDRIGKAISDPTRCQILLYLLDGPHYPTALAEHLSLTKANLSNHLSCLRGCGLVGATQEGRRQRYELADPRMAHALDDLAGLALSMTAPLCGAERCVAS